jgi:hypothetical protein
MSKDFIFVLMILVIFGQFPHESNCRKLRKLGVSFSEFCKENEQNEIENQLQNILTSHQDEVKRQLIRKYLLPLAGRTSILNDFYNRF